MGNEDQKLEVAQPEATVPVAKVKKARKTKVKEATAPKKVRKTKKSEIKGADILAEILEAAEKGVVTEEILAAEVPSTSEVEASIPAEEVAPVATESVFHSALNEKREVMLAELSQISMKDEQGYLNPIFTEKMNEIAQKMEELKKEAAKIETVEQAQMRAAISSAMNIRDWLDRIIMNCMQLWIWLSNQIHTPNHPKNWMTTYMVLSVVRKAQDALLEFQLIWKRLLVIS